MDSVRIIVEDLSHPAVIELIALHLRTAHENSPPGSVFALDLTGLRDPAVTVWSAWDGDDLLGLGAMKQIGDRHGELKSMRTHPDRLRQGVAARMLDHLIAQGRARGYRRLSLETGMNAPYAAARALYERAGFVEYGPFADYRDTVFSRYYSRVLSPS